MTGADVAKTIIEMKEGTPRFTDWDVLQGLIQPCDREAEWVIGRNNYTFWWWLGHYFSSRHVLEIGCRFGYSLWAVADGSSIAPSKMTLTVYDAELDDDKEPLKVMEAWFADKGYSDLHVHRQNTQSLSKLTVTAPVDVATVDANHSELGAYHDCGLAWDVLRPGGALLIDDCVPGEVRIAAERFAKDKGVAWGYVPSLRGIFVILKPE